MSTESEHAALRRSRRFVLPEMLSRNARLRPEHTALIFEGTSRTYAELEDRAERLAGALAARGVGHGDKVALLLYNRLEVVEAWFGCQKLGACPVPVNFRLVQEEVDYVLDNADAVGVIADERLADIAAVARTRNADLRFHLAVGGVVPADAEDYEEVLAAAEPPAGDAEVREEDLAFLMYTSGTTGRPKGAMLSQLNLVANTLNWTHEMQVGRDDVWLSGLPLFHIGGINGVLPFLYVGGTVVITPSTGFDALQSLRQLEAEKATLCYFVPTQWAEICALPEIAEVDTSRLRKALWGASMAPPSVLESLVRTFPSVEIVNAFGQTEMSSNTCFLKGEDAVRKMGSVGKPAINVEVRVIDPYGGDVSPGEVGEIVYRGPTVMQGYYRNEQATAEAFAGGWFHSGDLVRVDDEGFITVVDRMKDLIISGGENVYPAEVERAVLEHPAVQEAAVIGIPHPKWVETPMAIVVLAEGAEATEEELIAHCRERLAGYKKPGAVAFVDALPRNAAGKILKRHLRDDHAERFAAAGR
jgi:acyl-CoA synthetase (AMP-forming)/AMP-acid ligase II